MDITTVLLDAGGVIIDETDYETMKADVITNILAQVIPCYSTDDYYADIEEAVKSFCPDAYSFVIWKRLAGDLALFEEFYATFRAEAKRRGDAMRMKLSDSLADKVRAISKRYSIGIAGQYGREILDLLESHAILDCFAHRYTQDDFSITKPDPRYFEQIAAACGVDPMQCIMVGDRIDKDIIPAKLLGMGTILIRTGLHVNQLPRIPWEIPDIELPSVKGLASAIQELSDRFG